MLGMVFTEFVEMVEARHSVALADAMIEAAALPHGGAYTAVGYYEPTEFLQLLGALSQLSGEPMSAISQAFGRHLAGRFSEGHGQYFAAHRHPFDLLASVDGHIHVEVRKLYPQAQLPRFEVLARQPGLLRLAYRSPRGLCHLALGLIEGVLAHYGVAGQVAMQPDADGAVFDITETV